MGIADGDTAGFLQRRHLRKLFAFQVAGECAGGEYAGVSEFGGGAVDEFDHRGIVDHRIGVRRTKQCGNAAARGRRSLAGQRAFVLEAGFPQTGGEVDQPRADDLTGRVDDFVSDKFGRRVADGDHLPVIDV